MADEADMAGEIEEQAIAQSIKNAGRCLGDLSNFQGTRTADLLY